MVDFYKKDRPTPLDDLLRFYRLAKGSSSSILKTVTGALLHITDALAKNAKMVKAYIEPVQSGSGDPSPDNVRPITGHTKCDVKRYGGNIATDLEFVNGYYANDGTITASNNAIREDEYIPVGDAPYFDITYTPTITGLRFRVHEYGADKTWLRQRISDGDTTQGVQYKKSWTASADAKYIRFSMSPSSTTTTLLQGTTYSVNWNLLNTQNVVQKYPNNSTGALTASSTGSYSVWAVLPSGTYVIQKPYSSVLRVAVFNGYSALPQDGTVPDSFANSTDTTTYTLTLSQSACVVVFIRNGTNAGDQQLDPYVIAASMCISESGIVYSGTLDLTTGVLTAYPYYGSYNGETLTGHWISDRDVYAEGATPTTGAQVVNDGGTPTTYQLTPTQITMLLGENNLWNDANGDTEVTYLASS